MDNLNTLVSVILPNYNHANYLSKRLESIYNQTYSNWECVVVDRSNDQTESLIQNYILKDYRFQYHKRPIKHLSDNNCARI